MLYIHDIFTWQHPKFTQNLILTTWNMVTLSGSLLLLPEFAKFIMTQNLTFDLPSFYHVFDNHIFIKHIFVSTLTSSLKAYCSHSHYHFLLLSQFFDEQLSLMYAHQCESAQQGPPSAAFNRNAMRVMSNTTPGSMIKAIFHNSGTAALFSTYLSKSLGGFQHAQPSQNSSFRNLGHACPPLFFPSLILQQQVLMFTLLQLGEAKY